MADSGDFLSREPSPKRQRTTNGYAVSQDDDSSEPHAPEPSYHASYDIPIHGRSKSRPVHDDDNDTRQHGPSHEFGDGSDEEGHQENGYRNNSQSSGDASPAPTDSYTATPVPPPATPPLRKPVFHPYAHHTTLTPHKRGISAVKFSPCGNYLASASADCTLVVHSISPSLSNSTDAASTGNNTRSKSNTDVRFSHYHTYHGHLAGLNALSFSPDSALIATASDDKTIRLWSVPHKSPVKHLVGHANHVYAIAFSPKGNMLVSASYDEAVFLWDVRMGHVMRTLPAHADPVAGVDFVWDGSLVVSCAHDGLVRIWDTATGQCLRTLVQGEGLRAPVTNVKFSPNGRFVLSWCLDGCMRLWNYIEGRCVKTYTGHVNRKFSICGAWGTYGAGEGEQIEAFVVGGSEDGAVLWWDVISKKVLQRVVGHDGVVLGVDTHPTGSLVASCGSDRKIVIWSIAARERLSGDNGDGGVNGVEHQADPTPQALDTIREDRGEARATVNGIVKQEEAMNGVEDYSEFMNGSGVGGGYKAHSPPHMLPKMSLLSPNEP